MPGRFPAERAFVTLLAVLVAAAGGGASAAPLSVVSVNAPAVNCKFDPTCRVVVKDTSANFTLPAASGSAFLQSRTWPVGVAGTPGAGLIAYLYRLDLRQVAGLTALPCVTELRVDFGPVAPVDYNDDGTPDQVFVVTTGGLGSVGPSAVSQTGSEITFTFGQGVCAGSSPGQGQSSYFFGLASKQPPRSVTAQLKDSLGGTQSLQARAPKPTLLGVKLPPKVVSFPRAQ